MRKLLVGLGNPGPTYARTRHNIGFLCVEELAVRHNLRFSRSRHFAEVAAGVVNGQPVVLARPQTFMNESGRAVASLSRFYDIATTDCIVVYDDLDLPFGTLRLRTGGSAGGHRGLQSIIQHLRGEAISRLRVGVGRPPSTMPAERYVLTPFNAVEREQLPLICGAAAAALTLWIAEGMTSAMNRYNGWSPSTAAGR